MKQATGVPRVLVQVYASLLCFPRCHRGHEVRTIFIGSYLLRAAKDPPLISNFSPIPMRFSPSLLPSPAPLLTQRQHQQQLLFGRACSPSLHDVVTFCPSLRRARPREPKRLLFAFASRGASLHSGLASILPASSDAFLSPHLRPFPPVSRPPLSSSSLFRDNNARLPNSACMHANRRLTGQRTLPSLYLWTAVVIPVPFPAKQQMQPRLHPSFISQLFLLQQTTPAAPKHQPCLQAR